MAGASTTAMPYMAKPMPCLSGGKVSARMACSLGPKPPPPAPCSTRKKISMGSVVESPQNSELMVNSSTQLM